MSNYSMYQLYYVYFPYSANLIFSLLSDFLNINTMMTKHDSRKALMPTLNYLCLYLLRSYLVKVQIRIFSHQEIGSRAIILYDPNRKSISKIIVFRFQSKIWGGIAMITKVKIIKPSQNLNY